MKKSLSKFGQFPWNRSVFAKIIENLNEAKPKSIGFDVFFSEKDKQTPEEIIKSYNILSSDVINYLINIKGHDERFRQQLNENSKTLCWHHVIPEMNHNELLGWRTNTNDLAVVFLRNKLDFFRNQKRIEINKKVILKYTTNITEIWSKGDSIIENTLYHINLGDWTSWYLSELNNVDAIEIDVINFFN